MKLTAKQTREFLREGGIWDEELQDIIEFREVDRKFVEHLRWCLSYEVVVVCCNGENKDKTYVYTEYVPATEHQESDHYYEREMKLIEVKPVKKMVEVTVWEEINETH